MKVPHIDYNEIFGKTVGLHTDTQTKFDFDRYPK